MPDEKAFSLNLSVFDKDGNILLEHTSNGHSCAGACTAYGHSIEALMKHYRDKREIEEGITTKVKAPRKVPAKLATSMPEDPDRAS
jgi:hypothetical protein